MKQSNPHPSDALLESLFSSLLWDLCLSITLCLSQRSWGGIGKNKGCVSQLGGGWTCWGHPVDGRGTFLDAPSLRKGWGMSLLVLLFFLPLLPSSSLTCISFLLLPTPRPLFSFSSPCFFFLLPFLSPLSLAPPPFLHFTLCPLSSLCLWPCPWVHLAMDLKTSHFSYPLDSDKS